MLDHTPFDPYGLTRLPLGLSASFTVRESRHSSEGSAMINARPMAMSARFG
jgi:hypothetical protein